MNWKEIYDSLNTKGFAKLPNVLSTEKCTQLIGLYGQPLYRSTVNMQRYRFGQGEYKYFSYPLPELIQQHRSELYPSLASLANQWMNILGIDIHYPASHEEFITSCHHKNQLRPTPLLLRYQQGGFNTLHQDLYGEIYFPFQVVFILTQKGRDHEGGELVITEQIPRAQSKATVVHANQGDAVIFTTNFRPVKGSRGHYRATLKHGVSEVTAGERYALGIIFHDAT
ncbi:MAG: prolyl 4-hydroxylase subunit alpha [Azospira oryzae]|nr:MAG: prolyl 4-hydroxylase subunit alpha [Azospira oryzae]